jgi:hypothetical membrane protein
MNSSPLVPRTVRSGAALLIFGAVQFIVAMIVVQSRYPGYSLSQNYISDLGGANSPWALVFDASVILLGVCAIFGVLLVWSAFPAGRARGVGLGFLLIAGVGAIGVGAFPETTPVLHGQMHDIVSDVAFLGSGIGLTVVSFAMAEADRWRSSRALTLACGIVTLAAIVLFSANVYLGIGPGGMERVVVAPVLLWAIVEGIHIARFPRFAPSPAPVRVAG